MREIYGNVGLIILLCIRILFLLWYLKAVFNTYLEKYQFILCTFVFVFLGFYFSMWDIPFFDLIFTVVSYFIVAMLFSEYKRQQLLYYGIVFFIYLFFVQTGSQLLRIGIPWMNDEVISKITQVFIFNFTQPIILISTQRMLINLIKKHQIKHINWQQSIFMCCLGFFEVYILWDYASNGIKSIPSMFILFLGFLSVDIYLSYLFEHLSLQKEENEKRISKEYQSKLLEIQYDIISHKEIETQKFLHDIKAHLNSIESLYESKENNFESEKYIRKIYTEISKNQRKYFFGKRKLLEILINELFRQCEEKEITLEMDVEDREFQCLSDFDMTTLFANLFNNAVEASLGVAQKKSIIKFKIWYFEEQIMVNISNYFENDLNQNGTKYLSTKEKHRGIGLENIQETVKKLGGSMVITTIDSVFSVGINIPDEFNSDAFLKL